MLKITIDQMFDYLSDLFESVAWSDSTLTEIGNSLIRQIAFECNPETIRMIQKNKTYDSAKVIEAQIHALNTLVTCHNVARYLNFAPLLPHIRDLDRECTDTVLYILACTGDRQYAAVIRQEAERFPDLPQEEYIEELRAQSCGKD